MTSDEISEHVEENPDCGRRQCKNHNRYQYHIPSSLYTKHHSFFACTHHSITGLSWNARTDPVMQLHYLNLHPRVVPGFNILYQSRTHDCVMSIKRSNFHAEILLISKSCIFPRLTTSKIKSRLQLLIQPEVLHPHFQSTSVFPRRSHTIMVVSTLNVTHADIRSWFFFSFLRS